MSWIKKETEKEPPPGGTVAVPHSLPAEELSPARLHERIEQLAAEMREMRGKLLDVELAVQKLTSRSESSVAHPVSEADPDASAKLDTLLGRVNTLHDLVNTLLDLVKKQASASPLAGAGPKEFALADALPPLLEGVKRVEDQLRHLQPIEGQLRTINQTMSNPGRAVADSLQPMLNQLGATVHQQIHQYAESQEAAIRQLWQKLEEGLREIVGYLRPPEPEAEKKPASLAEWERAIFGPALAENQSLAFQRQQLLEGVLAGGAAACGFAGQLLVFQSAPPEKMPLILKDLGEAYYRWQPKRKSGNTKFEEALVAWLVRACDDAGLPNTIELVHPGERFDAMRHAAVGNQRGVEITEVLGWIVLRENGKVYLKATVAVK